MVNAWSLLFDELNMEKHSEHYYDYKRNDPNRKSPFTGADGYSVDGHGLDEYPYDQSMYMNSAPDTINFGATGDTIITGGDVLNLDLGETTLGKKISPNFRKYNEDEIIKELSDYITRTYSSHYSAGSDKIQTLDLIEACGDGEAFCRSNILKYASRYDKKGTARRDIMKIMHYAVLLMFFNDKNNKTETYNQ